MRGETAVSAERRTLYAERRALNAERRALNAERRTPNAYSTLKLAASCSRVRHDTLVRQGW